MNYDGEASLGHRERGKGWAQHPLEGAKGGESLEPKTKNPTLKGIQHPYLQGILHMAAYAVRG